MLSRHNYNKIKVISIVYYQCNQQHQICFRIRRWAVFSFSVSETIVFPFTPPYSISQQNLVFRILRLEFLFICSSKCLVCKLRLRTFWRNFLEKLELFILVIIYFTRIEYYHMILVRVFLTVEAQYFLSEKGQRIQRMSATLLFKDIYAVFNLV
jgi:hypothetical protein